MNAITKAPDPAMLQQVTGKATLVQPRYSAGQLLQDDDLTAGIDYTRHLNRLLMRHLFGCGVVCGLVVSGKLTPGGCLIVIVDCGLALDCQGVPVEVPAPQTITLRPDCATKVPDPLWVMLRGRLRDECGRELACPPDGSCGEASGDSVPARSREWFEIQVRTSLPEGACRCGTWEHSQPNDKEPEEKHYETCNADFLAGRCACGCCAEGGWVVLAKLWRNNNPAHQQEKWMVTHQVRRFVRPMPMHDPQFKDEEVPFVDTAQQNG